MERKSYCGEPNPISCLLHYSNVDDGSSSTHDTSFGPFSFDFLCTIRYLDMWSIEYVLLDNCPPGSHRERLENAISSASLESEGTK